MKVTIFTTLTLLISLLLVGCSDNPGGKSYNPPYYTPHNYTGMERELQKANLYCASSKACPESVGLIFLNIDGSEYSPRITQCTGFLIAEDIVATSSHCIPERLKASPSQCDGQSPPRWQARYPCALKPSEGSADKFSKSEVKQLRKLWQLCCKQTPKTVIDEILEAIKSTDRK